MTALRIGAALLLLSAGPAVAQETAREMTQGDPERGKTLFRACAFCHTLTPQGGNRAGPTLWNLFGRPAGAEHWRICFRRVGAALAPPPPPEPGAVRREGEVAHIDLRGMAPPGPLTAVLRLLDSGGAPAVMALFDRDPLPLHAQLAERGWECVGKRIQEDGVRLLLRRCGG